MAHLVAHRATAAAAARSRCAHAATAAAAAHRRAKGVPPPCRRHRRRRRRRRRSGRKGRLRCPLLHRGSNKENKRPPLSTLTSRATHAHPTSAHSTGFCAIWDCISSSSSSNKRPARLWSPPAALHQGGHGLALGARKPASGGRRSAGRGQKRPPLRLTGSRPAPESRLPPGAWGQQFSPMPRPLRPLPKCRWPEARESCQTRCPQLRAPRRQVKKSQSRCRTARLSGIKGVRGASRWYRPRFKGLR